MAGWGGDTGYTIVINNAKVFKSVEKANKALRKFRKGTGKSMPKAKILEARSKVVITVKDSPNETSVAQDEILELIKDTWEKNPELRLCELLGNAALKTGRDYDHHEDLFYMPDEIIVKGLKKWAEADK